MPLICCLTASEDDERHSELISGGMDKILVKPIAKEALLQILISSGIN